LRTLPRGPTPSNPGGLGHPGHVHGARTEGSRSYRAAPPAPWAGRGGGLDLAERLQEGDAVGPADRAERSRSGFRCLSLHRFTAYDRPPAAWWPGAQAATVLTGGTRASLGTRHCGVRLPVPCVACSVQSLCMLCARSLRVCCVFCAGGVRVWGVSPIRAHNIGSGALRGKAEPPGPRQTEGATPVKGRQRAP
jgi:hypothetical protein